MIQTVILKYINFDIFYTELWIDEFLTAISLDPEEVEDDDALSLEFSVNGYESKYFLNNAGTSMFYLAFYIIGWTIQISFTFVSHFSSQANTI